MARASLLVIRGREAKRREPGIHPTAIIAAQWIPGSCSARPGMTMERPVARRLAAQWHDGQDCASHRPQISGLRAAVPFRQEGRFAIVTNAGWDVVDARASARQGVAGRVEPRERYCKARRTNDVSSVRQNRVVLTPVAGAKSAVIIQTRPGLNDRQNPPTTVTRRIRRRGERGISHKAATQGMPGASAEPVCSCAPFSICV